MVRRHVLVLLGLAAAGGIVFWVLEATAQPGTPATPDEELFKQYDRFIEIIRLVQGKYVREVNTQKLFQDAIEGMLSGLDPFSNFIGEDEVDEFDKATRGKFSGIGIQIGMRKGLLTVISPLEDTPAYRAGVLAGDIIVEINGKSTEGLTLNDAVKSITGEAGTSVRLKVRHMTGDVSDLSITRAIIEVKTVKGHKRGPDGKWLWMADPEKKIAYVRVTGFVDNTSEELREVLDALVKDGLKGLVVDLRFNPGGQLHVAIDMVDMFLPSGIIVQTKGRTTPYWEARARKDGTLPYFPMVVLVNPFSASASEIVAGALQDHGRAIIVGERTFGKGSVQNVVPLKDGKARLKLTTSKYYLPNGRSIHREEEMTEADEWGVAPDIIVAMTPEEYIAILRTRQESEIIQNNGPAPEKTPAAPGPRPEPSPPGPGGVRGPDAPAPREPVAAPVPGPAPAPAPGPVKPDAAKPQAEPGDRQLQRALDLLRSIEIIEKYLTKKVA